VFTQKQVAFLGLDGLHLKKVQHEANYLGELSENFLILSGEKDETVFKK